MSGINYPIGADTPDAPWNKEDPKPKKVEVTVSITLSKTVEVEVDDYTAESDMDEDGNVQTNYNFTEEALKESVRNQINLPGNIPHSIQNAVWLSESVEAQRARDDLSNWVEDDFEVMLED